MANAFFTHRPVPSLLMAAVLAASFLTACGGGDERSRGELIAARSSVEHAPAEIDRLVASSAVATGAAAAACGVKVSHISYVTRDPQGAQATATAAVMTPTGTAARCQGPRPILLYAHGTTPIKSYNMADPRNTPEALLVEATFAAQGYVVVAPNYLGYDGSSLAYHPYLNGEAQAVDMIDGLRAGLTHVGSSQVRASGKLLVAGYSQGGYVAMYTHKVLERDHASEFPVAASVPMSGPYDPVGFSDRVMAPDGQVNLGATLFIPLLTTSYQRSYGDLYVSPSEIYQAPFDGFAPGLLPSDVPVATLVAQGKLPNDPTFSRLFGDGGLLTDAFRAGYQTSAFRRALQRNTLLGWTPKADMALCGGDQDPTVYFFNASTVQADFASRGVSVPLWNLESVASLPEGASSSEIYLAFQGAKAKAGNGAALRYHGELVPPFCMVLARQFFGEQLADSPIGD